MPDWQDNLLYLQFIKSVLKSGRIRILPKNEKYGNKFTNHNPRYEMLMAWAVSNFNSISNTGVVYSDVGQHLESKKYGNLIDTEWCTYCVLAPVHLVLDLKKWYPKWLKEKI